MDDLKHGGKRGLLFDPETAERAYRFFEKVLCVEGDGEFIPFDLHESQAFIVGSLYGWFRWEGERDKRGRLKKDAGKWQRRFRTAYVEQGKGNGKALALDTPIPTPSGWTTMGELRAGDQVLDELGNPCRVI